MEFFKSREFLHKLEEDFIVSWTLQLYREFSSICYEYGLNVQQPIIAVEDLKSCWGDWDSYTRTIRISKNTIKNYSWDIVLGILKHEMAHLIVSEVFKETDGGHGKSFETACQLISVPHEFRKAFIELQESLPHWKETTSVQEEEEQLLKKIEKLLSLSQSSNEHEALRAMERVQELYSKYNIQRIKEQRESNFVSLILDFKKKRIEKNYCLIASILKAHFFVNIVYSDRYDALHNETYKTIVVLGNRHNVLMAEYVFYFLQNKLDELWSGYQKMQSLPGKYRVSYQQGILIGFRTKLEAHKKEQEKVNKKEKGFSLGEQQLLVIDDEAKLEEFTHSVFPRLSSRTTGATRIYSDHFDQGKSAGKAITLTKPIAKERKGPLLLGG